MTPLPAPAAATPARAFWQRLSRTERAALAAGLLVAAGQLLVLVQLSQESVLKGERLRAEQAAQAAAER